MDNKQPKRLGPSKYVHMEYFCKGRQNADIRWPTLEDALKELSELVEYPLTAIHFRNLCKRMKLEPLQLLEKLPAKKITTGQYEKLSKQERRYRRMMESNRKQTAILNAIRDSLDVLVQSLSANRAQYTQERENLARHYDGKLTELQRSMDAIMEHLTNVPESSPSFPFPRD